MDKFHLTLEVTRLRSEHKLFSVYAYAEDRNAFRHPLKNGKESLVEANKLPAYINEILDGWESVESRMALLQSANREE